ncbi:MAG: hypothetical protein H6961_11120 [Chromatiaceae bacterium]|nr:hypothetical protein [Chromatiaceae bacterium]
MSRIDADRDDVTTLRGALLIGLACYAELDRLIDQFATHKAGGFDLPQDLRPIQQSGAEALGDFANALRFVELLDGLVRMREQGAEA